MCSDIMCQVLGAAFLAHVIWVQFVNRQIRRDILSVPKNARQARTELLTRKSYKKLSD